MLAVLVGCATARIRPPAGSRGEEPVMEVSGYCNCGTCCEWHRTWLGTAVYDSGPLKGRRKRVGVTASGQHARLGTLAADTRRYPFGTVMYVPGYGYGRVEDTGAKIVGDRVDLWFPTHAEAEKWGRQKLVVKVWLPRGGASRAVKRTETEEAQHGNARE
jgi:3D (Asp-Asp-Asp) domain-containing protein